MGLRDQSVGKLARGRVITFYSFKGGVGRTMAVANVAALLAQRGKRVLVMDFDFEAPGLHRYFLTKKDRFERFEPEHLQQGVINLFGVLRERLRKQWPDGEGFGEPAAAGAAAIIGELLSTGDYVYRVRLENPNKKRSPPVGIDFIPAAKFDATYTKEVRSFDWQDFYDKYAEVLPVLAEELGKRYEYVLIDSRTGVTDIGSICTMLLPDKLVLVFSPNNQSLSGALDAGWQSVMERKESADPRPLPLFPLLSRVDDGEERLKREWVSNARGSFERLFRKAYELEHCDLEMYFNLVRIPHRGHYAYGEEIAVESEAVIETGSLAQAYHQFLECLEHENATDAQSMLERAEEEREQAILRKLETEEGLQELIQRDPDNPSLELLYATFLFTKGRVSESIAVLDGIIERFGNNTEEVALQNGVAIALFNKGVALGILNRFEEALSAYEELLRRFLDAPELSLRERVATALFNKGVTLRALNRHEEALAAYEELLHRFRDAPELSLREQVARALVNKGAALRELNRLEEALAAYEELLHRFLDAPELSLRELVAKALFGKGNVFNELNRSEEGLAAYEELLRRFEEAPEPAMRRIVAGANNSIGFSRLLQAKQAWLRNDQSGANDLLSIANTRIAAALKLEPEQAIAIGNAGYIAFLQGREDEARSLLSKAIALGGEKLRQAELDDADIHSLPQDEAFRALVRSIPAAS